MYSSKSEAIKNILAKMDNIATSNANVLISGESGTGKELLAKEVHLRSLRSKKEFVSINCTAIPETLLESELFGHKKGSFTGATTDHKGLFELADGGTIFLDEIGDMPLAIQAKMLRVLQERKIRSLGSSVEKSINFRLISATHRDLREEVKKGNFREDLFYRLSVVPLYLPALRNRKEDIPYLANKFLANFSDKYNLKNLKFSDEAIEKLIHRKWPGNIRELQNFIERIVVMNQEEGVIDLKDLSDEESVKDNFLKQNFLESDKFITVEELTNKYIHFILKKVNSHQGEASKILGLSRRTLYRKLKIIDVEHNHNLFN